MDGEKEKVWSQQQVDAVVDKHQSEIQPVAQNVSTTKKVKSTLKLIKEWAPYVLIPLLAVAVVFLRSKEGSFDDMSGSEDHYKILGVKRSATTKEIQLAYEMLGEDWNPEKNPSCDSCEEKWEDITTAFNVLTDEKKRKVFDKSGYDQSMKLFQAIKTISADNWAEVKANSTTTVFLVEVHAAVEHHEKKSIRFRPPNIARIATKTANMLKGFVTVGRINFHAEKALIEELGLQDYEHRLPMVISLKEGQAAVYDGEVRILKLADFVGESMETPAVESVDYKGYGEFIQKSKIKIVMFRRSVTRMVMIYRNVAKQFGHAMRFAEIDVRSHGTVNLWRKFDTRKLPLVVVLRENENQDPAVLGGAFNQRMLVNFLASSRYYMFKPLRQQNFESVCMEHADRTCAIFFADPKYVNYKKMNTTLSAFASVEGAFKTDAAFANKDIILTWHDNVNDTAVLDLFNIKNPDREAMNFGVVNSKRREWQSLDGNLNEITEWDGKAEDFLDFVKNFMNSSKKSHALPAELFPAPASAPWTMDDLINTRNIVLLIVFILVIIMFGFSYVVFLKEDQIRKETGLDKKIKKKAVDGNYSVGE